MEHVLNTLTNWISGVYGTLGYWGIILFMGIESACIPLPSEVIMPIAGYFVAQSLAGGGHFNLWLTGVAGALGCVWGSVVAYYAGLYGGRPFVEKYGRYVLIRRRDIDRADRWYQRYGMATVFFSRLLPIVRTFISFPAGMHRVNLPKFILYTFLGSFPWCLVLSYVGMVLGRHGTPEEIRKTVSGYFHGADVIVGIFLLVVFALWLRHHLKPDEEETPKAEPEKLRVES
ncbi:MAG: DedA family protein [Armatimonadota bacterium]|nr:DedA family protein [Armatimonadota bacterium]